MVRIVHRGFGLACAPLLLTLWGCEYWDTSQGHVADPNAIVLQDSRTASGTYDVSGVTVQAASGVQREVSGTIWLRVEGVHYAVEFKLDTTAPESEDPAPVQVTGIGNGVIVAGIYTGTTAEQISGTDPETGEPVDAARLKIVSTSRAHFDEAGLFRIHLENSPYEGQHYSPSMTGLSGRRIASLPEAAAPFPAPDQSPSSMWK